MENTEIESQTADNHKTLMTENFETSRRKGWSRYFEILISIVFGALIGIGTSYVGAIAIHKAEIKEATLSALRVEVLKLQNLNRQFEYVKSHLDESLPDSVRLLADTLPFPSIGTTGIALPDVLYDLILRNPTPHRELLDLISYQNARISMGDYAFWRNLLPKAELLHQASILQIDLVICAKWLELYEYHITGVAVEVISDSISIYKSMIEPAIAQINKAYYPRYIEFNSGDTIVESKFDRKDISAVVSRLDWPISDTIVEQLLRRFTLGFALLTCDGHRFFIANVDYNRHSFDWISSSIDCESDSSVTITLPDITGSLTLQNSKCSVSKELGLVKLPISGLTLIVGKVSLDNREYYIIGAQPSVALVQESS